jgi:hypothetical protein
VVELGLRERKAAIFLDGLDAARAVAAEAGQNNPDGVLALILGERDEEGVHRGSPRRGPGASGQLQHAAGELHGRVGRDDEDVVGDEGVAVLRLRHRHGRAAAQDIDQRAGVVGIEMLDQDERHAGVRRRIGEEGPEGLQAAGRGAQADSERDPGLGRCPPRTWRRHGAGVRIPIVDFHPVSRLYGAPHSILTRLTALGPGLA